MLVLIALATALRFISLGGGLYETQLLDRVWPARMDMVQPSKGGVSRGRFWIPAHLAFEAALLICLVWGWSHPPVRLWLLVALVVHSVMRVWSAVRFIPLALRFERGDPQLDRVAAVRWTRASRWRLPLDVATGAAMMMALTSAAAA